jgi:hypothetical protein
MDTHQTEELLLPTQDEAAKAAEGVPTEEAPLPAAGVAKASTGPGDHELSRQRRSLAEFS